MTTSNWNETVIAEFRANDGKVAQFAGADLVVMHHVGRRSGTEYLAPVVFFTQDDASGTMYVVASAAGAPRNPQWYDNMTAAGRASVEVGRETFDVDVEEITGAHYERVFADMLTTAPDFADYETKIAGARVMPILTLRRRAGAGQPS